jgi:uncharacterized protein involved in exopolysaccharide biosynthesis
MSRQLRARWWVIALCVIAGVAAAAVVGIKRHPVYTSSAVVSVGPLSSATTSDSATATDLALDYAAILTTNTLDRRVAAAMDTEPSYVSANLSAAPVTGVPIVEITGSGASAALARRLANAGAAALVSYFATQTGIGEPGSGLLKQYAAANQAQQQQQSRVARLESSGASSGELEVARISLAVARLKATAIGAAFTSSVQANGIGGNVTPTVVSAAATSSSDRRKKLVEFVVVGFFAGLCLAGSLLILASARTPPVKSNPGGRDGAAARA